jgi:hypothetical protein
MALVAHRLADGRYALDDEPAQGPDVLDVACARLRGASAESLVAALQARTLAGPQRLLPSMRTGLCMRFQELASMALVPLPFEATR